MTYSFLLCPANIFQGEKKMKFNLEQREKIKIKRFFLFLSGKGEKGGQVRKCFKLQNLIIYVVFVSKYENNWLRRVLRRF